MIKTFRPYEITETKETKDGSERTSVGTMSADLLDRDKQFTDQETLWKAFPAFMATSGIVVYMHDWGGGIGSVIDFSPVRGEKSMSRIKVSYGQGYEIPTRWGMYAVDHAWQQIKQRVIRTHSFGFAADEEPNEDGTSRLLVRDVYEVSVVTVPALRDATIDMVKSLLVQDESSAQAIVAKLLQVDGVAAALRDAITQMMPARGVLGAVTLEPVEEPKVEEPTEKELDSDTVQAVQEMLDELRIKDLLRAMRA